MSPAEAIRSAAPQSLCDWDCLTFHPWIEQNCPAFSASISSLQPCGQSRHLFRGSFPDHLKPDLFANIPILYRDLHVLNCHPTQCKMPVRVSSLPVVQQQQEDSPLCAPSWSPAFRDVSSLPSADNAPQEKITSVAATQGTDRYWDKGNLAPPASSQELLQLPSPDLRPEQKAFQPAPRNFHIKGSPAMAQHQQHPSVSSIPSTQGKRGGSPCGPVSWCKPYCSPGASSCLSGVDSVGEGQWLPTVPMSDAAKCHQRWGSNTSDTLLKEGPAEAGESIHDRMNCAGIKGFTDSQPAGMAQHEMEFLRAMLEKDEIASPLYGTLGDLQSVVIPTAPATLPGGDNSTPPLCNGLDVNAGGSTFVDLTEPWRKCASSFGLPPSPHPCPIGLPPLPPTPKLHTSLGSAITDPQDPVPSKNNSGGPLIQVPRTNGLTYSLGDQYPSLGVPCSLSEEEGSEGLPGLMEDPLSLGFTANLDAATVGKPGMNPSWDLSAVTGGALFMPAGGSVREGSGNERARGGEIETDGALSSSQSISAAVWAASEALNLPHDVGGSWVEGGEGDGEEEEDDGGELEIRSSQLQELVFGRGIAGGQTPPGEQGPIDRLDGLGVKELREMFSMSIIEVAETLGVGLTVLKRHCRALGILRWPHRKIDSLNKLIAVFEGMDGSPKKEEVLRVLEAEKEHICRDPTAPLGKEIKVLRQAYFKAQYKRRKATEASAN